MSYIRFRKLHHPETLKYKIELVIGWRSFSLSGFWFGRSYKKLCWLDRKKDENDKRI